MISKILIARPHGFCAGVDRAIDIVYAALEIFGPPIYVKHEIVHNIHVTRELETKGVIFIEDLNKVPLRQGSGSTPKSTLIFSAHGISPNLKEEAKKRGLRVIDATCPLVTKVHLEAKRYAREGYFIIYVGHKNHPEPLGVFGEVPKDSIALVENIDDVAKLKIPQEEKLVYLTQTTLSVNDVSEIITALKSRFKNISGPPSSDICYATTNRQIAARELAMRSDLVLVIGSRTSSNSKRLVDVCEEEGTRTYLVDDEAMIKKSWLLNVEVLGITSGASAPEYLIGNIINFVKKENRGAKVEYLDILEENIKFPFPDDLAHLAQNTKAKSLVEKHKVRSQN